MKLIYAKNPKWANKQKTLIDLIVRFEEIDEDLPFTANQNDPEQHGRELFEKAISGEFGTIEEYSPPVVDPEQLKQQRIYELKQLLNESDYKVLPDYDKPDDGIRAQRQAWREEIRKLEA
jgi:hypothetical protein